MRILFLFAAGASLLPAGDTISIGLRGGLPFGEGFKTAQSGQLKLSGRNRFLIGPTLELRLPAGLGASFDALYRRLEYKLESGSGTTTQGSAQWEFPLMVRYRFPGLVVRPYLAGGPSLQRLTGITSIRNSTVGVALGAGLDIKVPFLHITPEMRYTRRFQDVRGGVLNQFLDLNKGQFDVVVGLTF